MRFVRAGPNAILDVDGLQRLLKGFQPFVREGRSIVAAGTGMCVLAAVTGATYVCGVIVTSFPGGRRLDTAPFLFLQ